MVRPAEAALSPASQQTRITQRIDRFSADLLGKKYEENPLAEDASGRPFPQYRLDAFDAISFVETVLALSLADSQIDFEIIMNRLRYKNGDPNIFNRNFFMSADWIPQNIQQGFVVDVTEMLVLAGDPKLRCLQLLKTPIDRKEWFLNTYDLNYDVPTELSKILVLTRETILMRPEIVARIPSSSIASFAKDGRHMRRIVGTELDITHVGLLIRKQDGQLYLRHARGKRYGVVEEHFVDYMRSQPQWIGVNIQQVTGVARN